MIKSKDHRKAKKTPRVAAMRDLGLPDSVLKLFPKTSRMAKVEPSRWGQAGERKIRFSDQEESHDSVYNYG